MNLDINNINILIERANKKDRKAFNELKSIVDNSKYDKNISNIIPINRAYEGYLNVKVNF